MLVKKYNSDGQKARQRNDTEDRTIVYRDWLRTAETGGFFLDVDLLKWKKINGKVMPVAITELTRCDSDSAGENYRQAIIDRYFVRDSQGSAIQSLSDLLNIPAYLVLFQAQMKWLWVYSFRRSQWKAYSPAEWATYLATL